MSHWIGTRQAAAELGVTLRTLYRFIDEGRLPAYKMGRVIRLRSEDVTRFRDEEGPDLPPGSGPPGGVREPRRPRPGGPAGAMVLEDPDLQ